VGLPVAETSETIRMFRVVLESTEPCASSGRAWSGDRHAPGALPDFVRLQTVPGIGPILAMTILAERGISAVLGACGNS